MSVVERQHEDTNVGSGAPRMRHIAEDAAMQLRPIIAMCGYALPTIDGFDMEGDIGPPSTADCIVCAELARAKGYL